MACIVTAASNWFRLSYPPVYGLCLSQDPNVSLEVLQAQTDFFRSGEALLMLLPAYLVFSVWQKGSLKFSLACQGPLDWGRFCQVSCLLTEVLCLRKGLTVLSLSCKGPLGRKKGH